MPFSTRGGTLSFFDETLAEFIPSPFFDPLADYRAGFLHTSRLSPGCRIDTFAPLPAAKRANSFVADQRCEGTVNLTAPNRYLHQPPWPCGEVVTPSRARHLANSIVAMIFASVLFA